MHIAKDLKTTPLKILRQSALETIEKLNVNALREDHSFQKNDSFT